MGSVVRAHDSLLGRDVAIKLLPGGGGAELRERLVREAQALARVSHPHVVAVHELLYHGGTWLLVMDCAQGVNLHERLEQGRLPVQGAVEIARGLAEGLAALHQTGVVHRDVKPANVLIDAEGLPLLLDLGVAKLVDEANRLTRTGQSVGTPSYMAPEQVLAKGVEPRTDLYGLGATLYHMLTGSPPLTGSSLEEVLQRVLSAVPRPPHEIEPAVDRFLSAICLRCLAKGPPDRYPSALALADDLRRHQAGQRRARPRRRRQGALLLASSLIVAGVGAWLASGTSRTQATDAAAVGQEARELLSRAEPLRADAETIEALERRWQRLGPEASARGTSRVQALVGMLALARGRREEAEAALARATAASDTPAERALAAALNRDPRGLTRAIAGGLARSDLRAWRVEARFAEGLTAGTAREVLADLEALESQRSLSGADQERRVFALLQLPDLVGAEAALAELDLPPPALRWLVALARARLDLAEDPAGVLELLASLPSAAGLVEERRALAQTCLELCERIRRDAGAARLTPDQVEHERLLLRLRGLLAPDSPFPERLLQELLSQLTLLSFSNDRLGLVLAVADAVPERADVQRDLSLLAARVQVSKRDRILPVLRRAVHLEADSAQRRQLELSLCVTLSRLPVLSAQRATEVVELSNQLLPRSEDPVQRSLILDARGRARQALGQLAEALQDYQGSIAAHGVSEAYARRGLLLRELERPEPALADLLRYLETGQREKDFRRQVQAAVWELARAHGWEARARLALEREARRQPDRAGWWVRLAWLQLRLDDRRAAEASLRRAAPLDREPRLRDLAPRLTRLIERLDPQALDTLVDELERLRGDDVGP